jgi:integrase
MASIIRRPESKYFIACWTNSAGRRLKRSTKTTERKLAEKLARQFEAESRSRRTATQARRILSDIYKELAGEELPTVTTRAYFDGFVARKAPEVSRGTLDYYTGHSRRFLEWIGAKADRDIAEVTKAEITGYRNATAARVGPTATNNTLKAIRTFFAAARKDGYLIEDPAADVDTVRDRTESNRRPFKLDELRALLAVAGDEWRSLILFGLYSGQRLCDLAVLTWANLDLERGELRMTTRKTGRRLTLPLAAPLRAHIATLPSSDDPKAPLHPAAVESLARNKGRTAGLSASFADLLIAAGLRSNKVEVEEGGARARHELTFHSLRHTATSLLKEAGIPQSVVMDFIGHDTISVSHGYTHTGREALEKAASAFPAL